MCSIQLAKTLNSDFWLQMDQVVLLATILQFCITVSSALGFTTTSVDDRCYESIQVLCNNYTESVGCEDERVKSIGYSDPNYIIEFNNNNNIRNPFPDFDLHPNEATVVSFNLCYCEALRLTANQLRSGQMCRVSRIQVQYTIKFRCSHSFPLMLNNLTIILFERNDTASASAGCMNGSLTKYTFAIIDIRGM